MQQIASGKERNYHEGAADVFHGFSTLYPDQRKL